MIQIIDRTEDNELVVSYAEPTHFYGGEVHILHAEHANVVGALVTGADADDLITAAMAADVAHQQGNPFTLLIPYLPAARADRGNPFGAKVYADIINTMKAEKVVVVDPHSPVMPVMVNNIKILDFANFIATSIIKNPADWTAIISPDEGSRIRAGEVATATGLPMVNAHKHRDFETSRLSGFSCDPLPDPNGKYLIVDDCCDSGGTFLGLANVINIPKENLAVWATHGVFSWKSPALKEKFGAIYTTNSHPGANNPLLEAVVVDIVPALLEEVL